MGEEPRVPLAQMTDINTATIPVERLEQDSYDWYARHQAELELAKTLNPKVVLIGDSITHFWGGLPLSNPINGLKSWERVFGSIAVQNMGFGWDRTQNVLWRLRQGELRGLNPRWIVVAIGTNNLISSKQARANSPAEIVDGIDAICKEIHQKTPGSQILVMGILPRGNNANAPLRPQILETNHLLLERLAKTGEAKFIDYGTKFLQSDGSIPVRWMPDGTHPSDEGYQLWANALIAAGITP